MTEAHYPYGGENYPFAVFDKDDLINTIETNITDKEIAYALLNHLEETMRKALDEKKWVGIPLIGSIRIPPQRLLYISKEQKELRNLAKQKLTESQYKSFTNTMNKENTYIAKANAYAKYIVSIMAKRYNKLYKKLCKEKSIAYANMYVYSRNLIEPVIGENEIRYVYTEN